MALWLAISVLCSAAYTATMAFGAFPGSWAVKAAAVAALAVLARNNRLAAFALLLGSLGDALLALGPDLFVAGLAAFLCGHIVYTVCFLRTGRKSIPIAGAAAVLLFAAVFTRWLWPHLGPLRLPVALYIAAISAMSATSFRAAGLVPIGAVLFLLSDSLLAANRFVVAFPAAGFAIWLTYYCGQLLIALGVSGYRPLAAK